MYNTNYFYHPSPHLSHLIFTRSLWGISNILILHPVKFAQGNVIRNRFKGLDLIDRVPDELWMEVHDIVQETGIKTLPKKKKCKKAKWLSAEALQIAVKRREAKCKGEKETYNHLNAEFQNSKEK